jgi:hypothetical protein
MFYQRLVVSSLSPVLWLTRGFFFRQEADHAADSGIRAAALSASILLELPTTGIANDGAKEWLESLMRPDNDRHSERQFDLKSLFCYGEADIVTKFKVENTGRAGIRNSCSQIVPAGGAGTGTAAARIIDFRKRSGLSQMATSLWPATPASPTGRRSAGSR